MYNVHLQTFNMYLKIVLLEENMILLHINHYTIHSSLHKDSEVMKNTYNSFHEDTPQV